MADERNAPRRGQRGVALWVNQYEWEATVRDRAAEQRDQFASERDSVAAARADAAAIRAEAAANQYLAAGTRARSAPLRAHPSLRRVTPASEESGEPVAPAQGRGEDPAAEELDRAVNRRDRRIALRERATLGRDFDHLVWLAGDDLWERMSRSLMERADRRDYLAELRDRAAEQRDQVAASGDYNAADARRDRTAAALDRADSAREREDAASDRAELIAAVRDVLDLAHRDRAP